MIVKVKIWGRYRKSDLIGATGNRVQVRVLAYELVQTMPEMHSVSLSQVRKSDQPAVLALYPDVNKPHKILFHQAVQWNHITPHIKIASGKSLQTCNLTIEGQHIRYLTERYGELQIPLSAVTVIPLESGT
jgi:hypothetical protein